MLDRDKAVIEKYRLNEDQAYTYIERVAIMTQNGVSEKEAQRYALAAVQWQ